MAASGMLLSFVGFGEAATAFVSGWCERRPSRIAAYDIKTDDPQTRAAMEARYAEFGIDGRAACADALAGADVIFSVVTADRALEAAQRAAENFPEGALWLDCNSSAPGTKKKAAELIETAGGRYVDVAVMAPVHSQRHHVPLLISGPHCEAAEAALGTLDMKPRAVGAEVGAASSIKMLRSVMIKGLEAVSAECVLAARKAGVEEEVIASLEASDPGFGWRRRASYNLERMMVHGARRAAEMREVAATVDALGLNGRMSAATALWQDEIASLHEDPGDDDLIARADKLLSRL